MKKLIIPILFITFSLNAFAQRGEKMQERIKAQKVAFITERLDLSSEEAQQFWPIYNAFEDKVEGIRKNDLKEVREAMRRGNLSDNEAKDILNKYMAAEDKLHEAKKQLVSDLKKVLPSQKIIALKSTEDAFNRFLMKKLRERKDKMQGMRDNKN